MVICPGCGGDITETIWVYENKTFCKEECVRRYAGMRTK